MIWEDVEQNLVTILWRFVKSVNGLHRRPRPDLRTLRPSTANARHLKKQQRWGHGHSIEDHITQRLLKYLDQKYNATETDHHSVFLL